MSEQQLGQNCRRLTLGTAIERLHMQRKVQMPQEVARIGFRLKGDA